MWRYRGDKRPLLEADGWSRGLTFVGVAVVILILILLVGYLATFDRFGSRPANQASAVSSLRTINTAEITYADTYKAGYSSTLVALGPPAGDAQPSAAAAGLVDSVLAGGVKSGYRFTFAPGPPDKTGHIKTYTVVARPLEFGKTERMSFFTDESGVIRYTGEDRPATAKDPPLGY